MNASPSQPRQHAYCNWRNERNHALLFENPSITLFIGAMKANNSCDYHSHLYPSFIYCLTSAQHIKGYTLTAPDYLEHKAIITEWTVKKGTCLPQPHCTPAAPFIHKVVTASDPVAFLVIEKPSSTQAAQGTGGGEMTCEGGAGVSFEALQDCPEIASGIRVTIEQGASMTVTGRGGGHRPVRRVIFGLEGVRIGEICVEGVGVFVEERREVERFGWRADYAVLGWEVDKYRSVIRNEGGGSWTGIVIDVW